MTQIDGTMHDVHWAATSPEQTFIPNAANRRSEYDIAIVGAGYCGLSIALHAAATGASVVVLEAGTVGCGASGRNGGIVVPHFPGAMTPDNAVAQLGPKKGEALAELVAGGAGFVFDQIRALGIECESEQNGWLQPAHSAASLQKVRKVYRSWQARGAQIEWMEAADVALHTGAQGYLGGWHSQTGGTVNPYALTLGLARVAATRGADIRENTEVTGIRNDGALKVLATAQGEIRARKVVLATNGYTPALYPGLARSVIPVWLYHGFTRPLDKDERARILPTRVCFTDLRKSGGFARYTSENRLIMGGAIFRPSNHRAWSERHSRRRLNEFFPGLTDLHLESFWTGYCALTNESLPAVQRLDANVYSLIGFSTRGVALAQTLGREMAGFLCESRTEADMPVRVGDVRTIALQPLKRFLGGFAFPLFQLRDALRLS